MSPSLHPHDLLDHALTEAGPLARELLNVVQDELDANPPHFPLREGWRKVRAGFAADFEGRLIELLQAGRRGEDPLNRAPLQLGGLESLSLVDEHQALQDVAIAHVAHAAEELSRAELHQIGNFYAALRGTARARERDNPLRPALYAAHAPTRVRTTSLLSHRNPAVAFSPSHSPVPMRSARSSWPLCKSSKPMPARMSTRYCG